MRACRLGGPARRLGLRGQGRGGRETFGASERGRGQGATAAAGRGPRTSPGPHRRRAGQEEGTQQPRGWRDGGTLLNGRRPARLAGQVRAALSRGRAGPGGRPGEARRGGAAHAAAYPPPRTPSPLAGQSAGTACGGRGLGTGVWEGPYRHRATPPPRLRRPRRGPPTAAPPRR